MANNEKKINGHACYPSLYGATCTELGTRFGVTRQRISQLHLTGLLAGCIRTSTLPDRKVNNCKYRKKYGLSLKEIAVELGVREMNPSILEKYGLLEALLKQKEII